MKHFVQDSDVGAATEWQRSERASPDRIGSDHDHPDRFAGSAFDRQLRLAEREQRANLMRSECFDDIKLRNPLWDMLIGLLAARRSGRQLSMSDLCATCDVPESTALRLIHQLNEKGYAEMVPDRSDRRRMRVSLTAKGQARFDAYLEIAEPRLDTKPAVG